ncbi:MAG: helix-turn-helix domain-containing protein [Clostridia bacterium]|nr:helix-turn-helix domain-containing protein [Clostridia bacterium]
MEIHINKTEQGTKSYPMHKHEYYEIMMYLKGSGVMRTENGNIPFSVGTIILMPPGMLHGSLSDDEFINISVGSDFENHFYTQIPISFQDNEDEEGKILASLIYKNRHSSEVYLFYLCSAFANYILDNDRREGVISECVKRIAEQISENAFDSNINIKSYLAGSGYSEDYIRACFKEKTGKTPMDFLSDIRINHARFLIDIYKNHFSLAEIAEKCGYTDYVYFSKKFKEKVGISPMLYKKDSL